MTAHRVEITLSQALWDGLELARGYEARASFVRRALESALREPGAPDVRSDASTVRSPSASTRASKKPVPNSYNEAMARQERLNKAKAGKR